MNNHKIASIFILVLVGLMGFGVHKLRAKAVAATKAAEEAKSQAETAIQQKDLTEIRLKTIDAKTAELRKVYTEWIPHFENTQTARAGEERIYEAVREGNILLLSQRFNQQELDKSNEIISHALVAELVVSDQYVKTLNWLGQLEQSIPSCRISKCKIERADRGDNVTMELKIQVPVLKKGQSLR